MQSRFLIATLFNTEKKSYHPALYGYNASLNTDEKLGFQSIFHKTDGFRYLEDITKDFLKKMITDNGLPSVLCYDFSKTVISWNGKANCSLNTIYISKNELNTLRIVKRDNQNIDFQFEELKDSVTLKINRNILSTNSAQLGVAIIFFSALSIEGDTFENTIEYLKWRFPLNIDKELLTKGAKRVGVEI